MAVDSHCWHSGGITHATFPTRTPHRCCHCGADGVLTSRLDDASGHGLFYIEMPPRYVSVMYGDEVSCDRTT